MKYSFFFSLCLLFSVTSFLYSAEEEQLPVSLRDGGGTDLVEVFQFKGTVESLLTEDEKQTVLLGPGTSGQTLTIGQLSKYVKGLVVGSKCAGKQEGLLEAGKETAEKVRGAEVEGLRLAYANIARRLYPNEIEAKDSITSESVFTFLSQKKENMEAQISQAKDNGILEGKILAEANCLEKIKTSKDLLLKGISEETGLSIDESSLTRDTLVAGVIALRERNKGLELVDPLIATREGVPVIHNGYSGWHLAGYTTAGIVGTIAALKGGLFERFGFSFK
jgi:hypothetical protein